MLIPSTEEIVIFRRKIIAWFNKNGKDYPWRKEKDPFRVLISEMMLRRTKAEQVVPVYEKFINEFPDINALAVAKKEKLEKILYPLGLRWRIPAFYQMAKEVREKHHSRIPDRREELTKLPGVGEYVAGAVLSIAFGKKEWLVDSNIVRIFKRYFGIITTKEGRRDRHVIEIARIYASGENPRKAVMGILDITTLICKPIKPACKVCSLKTRCQYALSLKDD